MDRLDWVFLGILVVMFVVAAGERLLGARQLAKSTLLWAIVLSCFFAASVYYR